MGLLNVEFKQVRGSGSGSFVFRHRFFQLEPSKKDQAFPNCDVLFTARPGVPDPTSSFPPSDRASRSMETVGELGVTPCDCLLQCRNDFSDLVWIRTTSIGHRAKHVPAQGREWGRPV